MYGMVNQAVRGLVIDHFGEDKWNTIASKAGSPTEFASLESYDDKITYDLVDAASEVLEMEGHSILQTFGRYWIEKIATAHYPSLMSKTGTSFDRFVANLDHLHSRIQATFPKYTPPSFRVKPIEEGVILVDYYSEREGLLPFVEGLFDGVGHHFDVEVTLEHIPDEDHPMPCKRMKLTYRDLHS